MEGPETWWNFNLLLRPCLIQLVRSIIAPLHSSRKTPVSSPRAPTSRSVASALSLKDHWPRSVGPTVSMSGSPVVLSGSNEIIESNEVLLHCSIKLSVLQAFSDERLRSSKTFFLRRWHLDQVTISCFLYFGHRVTHLPTPHANDTFRNSHLNTLNDLTDRCKHFGVLLNAWFSPTVSSNSALVQRH